MKTIEDAIKLVEKQRDFRIERVNQDGTAYHRGRVNEATEILTILRHEADMDKLATAVTSDRPRAEKVEDAFDQFIDAVLRFQEEIQKLKF